MAIKGLYNDELEEMLGIPVLPANCIKGWFHPGLVICNTAPVWAPGEHWVVIYIGDNRKGEFFDSSGQHPGSYGFGDFMDFNCVNGWTYNDYTLQHFSTEACGYHCMAFCVSKMFNINWKRFLSIYDNNLLSNDYRIVEWVSNVWGNNGFIINSL